MKHRTAMLLVLAMLLATLGAFSPDTASAAEETGSYSKITEALEKRLSEAKDGDEVIPVYIWITDIDHDEVLAETEKQFGMSVDEAIKDVPMFSEANYETMKNDDADIMDEIGQKLEADPELKEELEENSLRANEFIGLKRQISKAKYEERNGEFLSETDLVEKDLLFVSKFAPMIIANVSADGIKTLAGMDEVISLDEFINEKMVECQATSLNVTGGYYNKTVYGYTGTGVNVGIVNYSSIQSSCTANYTNLNINNMGDHSTRIAEIIGGDNSYAPNCTAVSRILCKQKNIIAAFPSQGRANRACL